MTAINPDKYSTGQCHSTHGLQGVSRWPVTATTDTHGMCWVRGAPAPGACNRQELAPDSTWEQTPSHIVIDHHDFYRFNLTGLCLR